MVAIDTNRQELVRLDRLSRALEARNDKALTRTRLPRERLSGDVRDPAKLEEQLQTIKSWEEDVDRLQACLPWASGRHREEQAT